MKRSYDKNPKPSIKIARSDSDFARRKMQRKYALPEYYALLIAELQGYGGNADG